MTDPGQTAAAPATGVEPVLGPTSVPVRLDQLTWLGAPQEPALTFRSQTVTYRELTERVAQAAAGLAALGVRRGDRVAVYAEKRIETVVAILAVSAAGAVFVPVNPLFKARHLAHVVADCGAAALITTAERLETVQAALPDGTPVQHLVVIGDLPSQPNGAGWDMVEWSRIAETAARPVPAAHGVIDTDIAAIFYTSGSTGGPKGVVLTHRNLLAGAQSVAGYLGNNCQDRLLAVLPLSFDAGFSQLTTAFTVGAQVVLTNYLLPRDVVRLCSQHQITGLTCVPPLWMQLAALEWPEESSRSLRYFANTGGRMPRATLDRLRALLPAARPFLMYGLTEAFRSTFLDPAEASQRPDSIGKAIPNTEVLVVRPDGSLCDPGEHGELVHRGALVSQGYWNDPERTARRFRPAPGSQGPHAEVAVWSGDTVYRDSEGFLYFVGRTDDMIKTSGYRVSPAEIEETAFATGQVREAVALGVSDDRLGEHIVLVVAAPCDEDMLRKELARELPPYMIPARMVVLPELPRSVNGKFDRVELRRIVESQS